MDRMIELQGVERCYPMKGQTVRALAGVDLNIKEGEFVAITGASGSGKSTLLNVLGCLDRPDSGQYRLSGINVASLDDEQASEIRNRKIGFVFQSFHLLPRLTVLENVLLPRRFARESIPGIVESARTLLERVGLGERLQHRPTELSGGQMQRAAIARALVLQPALLLADEPTGNLDSRSASDVLALIEEVHAGGQTVVLVTHDNDVAARAPRQIRLKDGKVSDDTRG
jgi:putative ABC transport system ATP-binding protein